MRTFAMMLLFGLAWPLAAGCDDDSGTTVVDDTPLFDTKDVKDTKTDTTKPKDTTQTTRPPQDTVVPDLIPDLDPPTIVSTTPADGATNVQLPLTVTIVFSEPLFGPSVREENIYVVDFDGNRVPGTVTLAADQFTATWTPTTNDQKLASPYRIRVLGGVSGISDTAGHKLVNSAEFSFTTANFPSQDGYRALAEKYAPVITSAVPVGGSNPQAQIPTKLDPDNDGDSWNLSNNKDWLNLTATSVIPAVYYNVAETPTHYFIHYMLYFPWVNHTTTSYAHGNGTNGYMVTVEKARGEHAERPIALHSYWKEAESERNMGFVTTESGIVTKDGPDSWCAHAELDQATLFEGDRFGAYIGAQTHRACLWDWDQGGALALCELPSDVVNGKKLVFEYKGGAPTQVHKGEGGWPADMSEVDEVDTFGYALIPVLSSLWPRRNESGANAIFQGEKFTYAADADRPADGLRLHGKFVDPMAGSPQQYGRPVWSWGYRNDGTSCGKNSAIGRIDGKTGLMAIDPAWYVWQRHRSTLTANAMADYNAEDGSGFALDYCFNGFVNIDNRTLVDGPCKVLPSE